MKPEKIERDLWWLLVHMFSFLGLQFGFHAREFWFGQQDPWNKDQPVKFRFFKMYLAALLGLVVKWFFVLLFGIYRILTADQDRRFFLLMFFPCLFSFGAFLLTLIEYYEYWKSTRNPH